jgi:hypothetical protein
VSPLIDRIVDEVRIPARDQLAHAGDGLSPADLRPLREIRSDSKMAARTRSAPAGLRARM